MDSFRRDSAHRVDSASQVENALMRTDRMNSELEQPLQLGMCLLNTKQNSVQRKQVCQWKLESLMVSNVRCVSVRLFSAQDLLLGDCSLRPWNTSLRANVWFTPCIPLRHLCSERIEFDQHCSFFARWMQIFAFIVFLLLFFGFVGYFSPPFELEVPVQPLDTGRYKFDLVERCCPCTCRTFLW